MIHPLKEWLNKNRTSNKTLAERMGISPAMITYHCKGMRVSDEMLKSYKEQGLPKSIINKLKKQGL